MTKKRRRETAQTSADNFTTKKPHYEQTNLSLMLDEIFSFRLTRWGFDPNEDPIAALHQVLAKLQLVFGGIQWDAYTQHERDKIFITMLSYLLDPNIQSPATDGSLLDIDKPYSRPSHSPQEFLCDLMREIILLKTRGIEHCSGFFLWKPIMTMSEKLRLEQASLNYENFEYAVKYVADSIFQLYEIARECGFEVTVAGLVDNEKLEISNSLQQRKIVEFEWPTHLRYVSSESEMIFHDDPNDICNQILEVASFVWRVRIIDWGSSPHVDPMQQLSESLEIIRKLFQRVPWTRISDMKQFKCALRILHYLLDVKTKDPFNNQQITGFTERNIPDVRTPQSFLFAKLLQRADPTDLFTKYVASQMNDKFVLDDEKHYFGKLLGSLDEVMNALLSIAKGICIIRELINRCGFCATFPGSLTPPVQYVVVYPKQQSTQKGKTDKQNSSKQCIQSSRSITIEENNSTNVCITNSAKNPVKTNLPTNTIHSTINMNRKIHMEEDFDQKPHPHANKNPAVQWKDPPATTFSKKAVDGVKDYSKSDLNKQPKGFVVDEGEVNNDNDLRNTTTREDMATITMNHPTVDVNEYQRLMRRMRELQRDLRQEKAKAQSIMIEKNMLQSKCEALEVIVQETKQEQDQTESELWNLIDSSMNTVTSLQTYQQHLSHVLNETSNQEMKDTSPELAQRRKLREQKYQEQIFWLTKENAGLTIAYNRLQEQVDNLFNLCQQMNSDNKPENYQALEMLDYYVRQDGTLSFEGNTDDKHSEMSEKLTNHALEQVKAIHNQASEIDNQVFPPKNDNSNSASSSNAHDISNKSNDSVNIQTNDASAIYKSNIMTSQISESYVNVPNTDHAFSSNNQDQKTSSQCVKPNIIESSVPLAARNTSAILSNHKNHENNITSIHPKAGEISLLEQLLQKPVSNKTGKSAMKSVYSIPFSATVNSSAPIQMTTSTAVTKIETTSGDKAATSTVPGVRNGNRLKQLLAEKVAQEKAKKSVSNDL